MRPFCKASLCLFLIYFVDSEAAQIVKYDPQCRSTIIVGDFSNKTLQMEAWRNHLTKYWNSEAVPPLSPTGKEFIEAILSRNETDSYSELENLYLFTVRCNLLFVLAEDSPGFCYWAQTINASTTWADCKDGRLALATIQQDKINRLSWCLATISESLNENGCKKLPRVNVRSMSKCHKKGTAYEIDNALKYYGKNVPCCILNLLYKLYNSDIYCDQLLAVSYLASLTELSTDIISSYSINSVLEIQYSVIDPKDKACCCKKRRERYLEVCRGLDETDLSNAIEKYANTECPPGAAYLK